MSKENQDKMLALLSEAEEHGYRLGCKDTLESLNVQPVTEEQAEDGIPVWNMESLPTRAFLDLISPEGYKDTDYSRIWPALGQTDIDAGKAEMNFPYVVHGKGDKIVVECDDEPAQTITPYKEAFFIYCLTPNKTYQWKMFSGTKVIINGSFKTTGRVRWMKTTGTKYPHNMRDIGFPKELAIQGNGMKFGRIYRGEHPDKIEVGSADHIYLRDQLGISVQLNLRNPSDDPARTDMFEKTYSYNIPAYATILTANKEGKDNFKNAFHALVTELNAGRNVLVNCWQGRDRTGTFCWFLQALCHMYPGYLQAHWELSSYDRCENSMIWEENSGEGKLRVMTSKFNAKWGADPYQQALGLAKLVGISDKDIHDFQEQMLA